MRASFVSVIWSVMSPRQKGNVSPSLTALFLVELLIPIGIEVVPIAGAILTTSRYSALSNWCLLSLLVMMIYILLFAACEFVVYCWPRAFQVLWCRFGDLSNILRKYYNQAHKTYLLGLCTCQLLRLQ
jgi:hypothetical protein